MNTEKTKKVTMATVKAFIRKNYDNLYVKISSSFDGTTDCVERVEDTYRKVTADNALGHGGVWTVGSSRDYIREFSNNTYKGFEISNCCGSGVLVTKIS